MHTDLSSWWCWRGEEEGGLILGITECDVRKFLVD